jgi:hypothetical protein
MSGQHRSFGAYLAQLLAERDRSVRELAHALNVERSLVYKWQRGERTPHLGSDYVERIAAFLELTPEERTTLENSQLAMLRAPRVPHLPRSQRQPLRRDVQQLLNYSPAHELRTVVQRKEAPPRPPAGDEGSVRQTSHEPSNVVSSGGPNDGPSAPVGADGVTGAVGNEGTGESAERSASESSTIRGRTPSLLAIVELVETALPLPALTDARTLPGQWEHSYPFAANTILYTSLEWGTLSDDHARIAYAERARAVARRAIEHGWQICHLIRLDKNGRRSLAMARVVLDLIGTGRYTALYFYANELILPARDLVIVPGHAAIELFATTTDSMVDCAMILRDPQQIAVMQDYFQQMTSQAKPLMHMYTLNEWVTFERLRLEAEEEHGAHLLVKDGLSQITEPLSWSHRDSPWAKRSGQSREKLTALIDIRKRRFAAFEAGVQRHLYREICPMRAVRRLALEGSYLQSVVVGAQHTLPVAERIEHLANVVALLRQHENYEIALVDTDQADEIPLLSERFWEVVGGMRVFTNMHVRAADGRIVHAGLQIEESLLVAAFQQYFDDLWERVSPRNKHKDFVVWWLQQQIKALR